MDIKHNMLESIAMDLYADSCDFVYYGEYVVFQVYRDDRLYEWCVLGWSLWGLTTTQAINLVVDCFRDKFGIVGV